MVELKEHIRELTTLTTILSDQNSHLAEENAELQEKLGRCTCGSENVAEETNNNSKTTQIAEVSEGIMVPVSTPTTGSAVSLPQQRAVGALAVIRIMVLSTLCSQWVSLAAMTALMSRTPSQWSGKLSSQSNDQQLPIHTLPVKKRPAATRWWGPHQQSWNPTGI